MQIILLYNWNNNNTVKKIESIGLEQMIPINSQYLKLKKLKWEE